MPTNYALLGAFTLCYAYIVASISTLYDPQIVVEAAFITAGMVGGLSVYAWTTKSDFTVMRGLLAVVGSAIFMTLLIVLLF